MSLNILWLGTLSIDGNISNKSVGSPAASRFQNSFIKTIVNLDNKVNVFSFNPYPHWPKGPLYLKSHKKKSKNVSQLNVNYINLPLIRNVNILIRFLFNKKFINLFNYDLVITYNDSFQNVFIGLLLKAFGIKWLSIFADGTNPNSLSENILHLSYYSFRKRNINSIKNNILFPLAIYPRENCKEGYHLYNFLRNTQKPYILYSGAINNGTGILNFIIEFFQSKLSNYYQLVICGKGTIPSNLDNFMKSKNIQFLGFLKDQELNFLSNHCAAFINPRLTNNIEWLNNFPSKLLGYLSFDSPTFSTLTKNLMPELKNLVISYKSTDDILEKLLNEKYIEKHLDLLNKKRSYFTWDKAVGNVLDKII